MIRKKQLAVAIATTFVAAGVAYAQQPAQKVEKVEVTGSNIKRTDVETVAPVTVITREEIERTGKPTVAEVLRGITANAGQSYAETFTNSFSPGATGISLRGLGQKSTLVLVNGRRMASYGFAQNIQDTYVDINSIPAAAVERIEVLKAGASAIYGSDAIAGVINIIMRKDYRGADVAASVGTSKYSDLNEYRASIAAGMGDVGRDKYNVLAVLDYYKRDGIKFADRPSTQNEDYRAFGGGSLVRGTRGAYVYPTAAGRVAFPGCADGDRIAASVLSSTLSGTSCVYNDAPYVNLFPATQRIGIVTRGTLELSPTLTLFGELGLNHNETSQSTTPASLGSTSLVFNPATGGVRQISNFLPVGNPSNPYSAATRVLYTFFDVGQRTDEITTDAGRAVVGAKGSLGTWDYEVGAGVAQSKTEQVSGNRVNAAVLEKAIAGGTYNFLSPGSGTIRASDLRINPARNATSDLSFVDAKVSGELMPLPAGALAMAAGVEYRRESLKDRPDPLSTGGFILGQGSTKTDGARNVVAAFAEFSAPVMRNLEAQLAGRYDRYSDFGSAFSPSLGLKWTPVREILVRGSAGKGFRAPTLTESSPSSATTFTSVSDPLNGNRTFNIGTVIQSNSALLPEKSKNYNFGAIFEPSKDFNVGVEWYKIRQDNLVLRDSASFVISQAAKGNPLYTDKVIRDPSNLNTIVYVIRKMRNAAFVETSGVDLDAKLAVSLKEMGKLTFTANYNYVISFDEASIGAAPDSYVNSNGFGTIPRYKGTMGLAWERGPWALSAAYRYTHSFGQVLAAGQDVVGSFREVDLYGAYTGFRNMTLWASVRNALNTTPPWDASSQSNGGYDFTVNDLRGRYFTVGMKYSFK